MLDSVVFNWTEIDADLRSYRVIEFCACLLDHISGIVDEIEVTAIAADHRIGIYAAIQRIGLIAAGQAVFCDVPGDRIGQLVADAVDGRLASEKQVIDFAKSLAGAIIEVEGYRALNRIGAGAADDFIDEVLC
jgi:hypothetical protein